MTDNIEHKDLPPVIFGLRFWVEQVDPAFLKSTFNNLLADAKFKVLNFSEHFFPVQGYTAIWLLAESHLALHTFPNNGWTYIELSGCNREKTDNFKHFIRLTGLPLQWQTEKPSQSFPVESFKTTQG